MPKATILLAEDAAMPRRISLAAQVELGKGSPERN
jgi:hypothetical protein